MKKVYFHLTFLILTITLISLFIYSGIEIIETRTETMAWKGGRFILTDLTKVIGLLIVFTLPTYFFLRKIYFTKNPIKKEISELTNGILNGQWQKDISKAKIESSGILDGREIIFEFLGYNENGCAFEHLTYVVSELGMTLTSEQIMRMNILASKLNVNK